MLRRRPGSLKRFGAIVAFAKICYCKACHRTQHVKKIEFFVLSGISTLFFVFAFIVLLKGFGLTKAGGGGASLIVFLFLWFTKCCLKSMGGMLYLYLSLF